MFSKRPIKPRIISDIGVKKKFLAGSEQHDAHEFLAYVIEQIDSALLKQTKVNYCRIDESRLDRFLSTKCTSLFDQKLPFHGKIESTLECCSCHSSWSNSEKFSNLTLYPPHNKSCTLVDCLNDFTKTERLEGVSCRKCGQLGDVLKRLTILKEPDTLCIHINRSMISSLDNDEINYQKLNTLVEFERILDISFLSANPISNSNSLKSKLYHPASKLKRAPFPVRIMKESSKSFNAYDRTPTPTPRFDQILSLYLRTSTLFQSQSSVEETTGENEYVLTAVVVHKGDHKGGHYVCYRSTRPDDGDSPWVEISDANLAVEPFSVVKNQEAFMLFYQKKKLCYVHK